MTQVVSHHKCLGEQQFEGIKGSPQHAAMSMNRVWLDFSDIPRKTLRELINATNEQRVLVKRHLEQNCRHYYFIGKLTANNDLTMRIYFLSKAEMEDFIVWAKVALPMNIADDADAS